MTRETIILGHATAARRLIMRLMGLTFDRPWKVTIERVEPGAGTDQEAVLRGKERSIAEFTGHDPDEVHEEMLARHYGTEEVDLGGGRILIRPARRTRTGPKKLNRSEMGDHIRYVEAFAARELGLELA